MGKIFKFMVIAFLENALNLGIFTHAPLPQSNLQAEFFENLFPPTVEKGGENYDLLYQNSIRKYEDDLEHWVIYILYVCNCSKCDSFTYSFVNNIYHIVWYQVNCPSFATTII